MPVPHASADRGEDALARLTALVRDDLEACNRLIVERMQSPVALIPSLRRTSSRPAASGCGRC
jgi:octaprenyl-diphosphate synthase